MLISNSHFLFCITHSENPKRITMSSFYKRKYYIINVVLTKNPPIMVAAAGLGLIQTIPKHQLMCMDPNQSKALAPAPLARSTTTLTLITSRILTKSSPISCMVGQFLVNSSPPSSWPKKLRQHQRRGIYSSSCSLRSNMPLESNRMSCEK